jgi:peptidylprolyl isomerase
MAAPNPPTDRKKLTSVLVPAIGVVALIVLVLVVSNVGGSSHKMSDGSDGTAEDSGLKELAPGVKYREIKEGEGEPCPPGAEVTIKYSGWLTDGTEFDSSKKGATFSLGNLIKGWQAGIPGMKPGGIRKLVISPDMGYGAKASGKIPANSVLIFEVELLSVKQKPQLLMKPDAKTLMDGTSPAADDPGLKPVGSEGLMIRDEKEGTGPAVTPGASVEVFYTGWLTNGTVFDSAAQRGESISFSLDGVVAGWSQGIPGMKVGGVRKLVVPAALGYGAKGKGSVPPNATMIFEVQLVAIK